MSIRKTSLSRRLVLHQTFQFGGGKVRGFAKLNQGTLVSFDGEDGLEHFARVRHGDHYGPMFIGVNQIAGLHSHAPDCYGLAEVLKMGMNVRDGYAGSNELKTQGPHFIEVADCTVSDEADAAKGAMDIGINFAP